MYDFDLLLTQSINAAAGRLALLDQVMIWMSSFGVPVLVALVVLQWWRRNDRTFVRHVLVASGLTSLLGL
jgi:undecaprenyl-diphosphatase